MAAGEYDFGYGGADAGTFCWHCLPLVHRRGARSSWKNGRPILFERLLWQWVTVSGDDVCLRCDRGRYHCQLCHRTEHVDEQRRPGLWARSYVHDLEGVCRSHGSRVHDGVGHHLDAYRRNAARVCVPFLRAGVAAAGEQ